ncbi:ABC transporter ATP-binding protein [Phaeacidiphilus oryzae]|uniref:ABC transporter ATP-binding protein n=1 Tax=Phaeacidiphilus oryzae TaxID=348818 RepID=UPI000A01AF56|nr:ABC transporter ATP-binding protein [Phaeacidiphilus oryzae]
MTPAQLHVEGLGKDYAGKTALHQVDFTVAPGRFMVLLGPSGSGKTTLLRCLAGIERPDRGSIRLGGRVLAQDRTHLPPDRRDLAMVFQDYALWPHMTAAANVGFALRRRRPDRAAAAREVAAVLEQVGLGHRTDHYPHQLSGGEQQRVALARALVARPGLLLFDEPLSNLDADLRERLRVEIARLTRESGATVVYITHDQAEAFALADEVGVLLDGRLAQLGSPEAIYRRPATASVARFTGVSAEFRGRTGGAVGGEGGQVLVQTDAGPLRATVSEAVAADRAVRVMVRPDAVGLRPADPSGNDARPGPAGGPLGRVVDAAFRGRGYDHVVELTDGTLLTGVFDRSAHPRGSDVRLVLDPEGCLAFPEPPLVPAGSVRSRVPAVDAAAGAAPSGSGDRTPLIQEAQ